MPTLAPVPDSATDALLPDCVPAEVDDPTPEAPPLFELVVSEDGACVGAAVGATDAPPVGATCGAGEIGDAVAAAGKFTTSASAIEPTITAIVCLICDIRTLRFSSRSGVWGW